jgi:hypothetical protein
MTMINWISNKIIKHFRNKAIAKIDANPSVIAKQHFSKQIDFLNQQYNNLQEIYWVGSYTYDEQIINYFKKNVKLSPDLFNTLPFSISTEDEDIIDIIIGRTIDGDWIVSLFSDKLDLYGTLKYIDSFITTTDSNFNPQEIKNCATLQ